MKKTQRLVILVVTMAVASCSTTIPVTPASASRSQFDGAAYAGVVNEAESPTAGAELYRAFQQGATGFVPLSAVRGGVEDQSNSFCQRKGGKVAKLIRETTSPALFLPGNFPRVEWVFECVEQFAATKAPPPPRAEDKLVRLERLKKLLDAGALTQQEFDSEKEKILNAP